MTLYVTERSATAIGRPHKYHVEDFRILRQLHLMNPEIQADGDELEYIQKHFSGIRMSTACRVVIWAGEDARFILKNMPS